MNLWKKIKSLVFSGWTTSGMIEMNSVKCKWSNSQSASNNFSKSKPQPVEVLNLFFYMHVSCFTSKTQPAVNGSKWRRRVTSVTPSDSSDGEIWEGQEGVLMDSTADLGDVERVVHERVPTSDFLFPNFLLKPLRAFPLVSVSPLMSAARGDTCRGSFLGASVLLKK